MFLESSLNTIPCWMVGVKRGDVGRAGVCVLEKTCMYNQVRPMNSLLGVK